MANASPEVQRGDPLQIAVGLWVLVHGIMLLIAALTFPWPAEPDELVDRLVADHLKGLLPTEDLQSGRELGGVRIENPFA
jgi:hypothetical protein